MFNVISFYLVLYLSLSFYYFYKMSEKNVVNRIAAASTVSCVIFKPSRDASMYKRFIKIGSVIQKEFIVTNAKYKRILYIIYFYGYKMKGTFEL